MDDYCKKEQVFLNKDEELRHNLKKNTALFDLFKKTMTSAFRNVKLHEEVKDLNKFTQWDTTYIPDPPPNQP